MVKDKGYRMKLSRNELAAFDCWLSEYQHTELKIQRLIILLSRTKDAKDREHLEQRIMSYENFTKTCNRVRDMLDDNLRQIFDLKFGRGSNNTWEEIADIVFVSHRHIYRKRQTILELFAEEIGRL